MGGSVGMAGVGVREGDFGRSFNVASWIAAFAAMTGGWIPACAGMTVGVGGRNEGSFDRLRTNGGCVLRQAQDGRAIFGC